MTRVCGSNETAAGHGCTNLVSDNGDHCAAGYKSVPPNPNCEHEDKTSCFCESVLTGKPWSPETEELATPPHAQQRIRVEWYQVQEAKFDDARALQSRVDGIRTLRIRDDRERGRAN